MRKLLLNGNINFSVKLCVWFQWYGIFKWLQLIWFHHQSFLYYISLCGTCISLLLYCGFIGVHMDAASDEMDYNNNNNCQDTENGLNRSVFYGEKKQGDFNSILEFVWSWRQSCRISLTWPHSTALASSTQWILSITCDGYTE